MYSPNGLTHRFLVSRKIKISAAVFSSAIFFLFSQNLSAQDITAGSSVIVLKPRAVPAAKKTFGSAEPKSKKATAPATAKRARTAKAPPAGLKTNRTKTSDATVRTISAGVLNTRDANLPKPEYPRAASMVKASGSVNVAVVIDENGDVISAEAVSGHALLRPAAVNAALRAQFEPIIVQGKPVRVSGVIVYNFVQ